MSEAGTSPEWSDELATLLNGMRATWYNTADGNDFLYIQTSMDHLVTPDGTISSFNSSVHSLDNIALGRELLLLYRVTQKEKYYKAAHMLREQLASQRRSQPGGLWHKRIYSDQMWLRELYMAEPFYAEYASVFHEPADFADITRQFTLIELHTHSPKSELLSHATDGSKKSRWTSETTGTSQIFPASGMGWYMMALVDTIPYYPENDPGRARLIAILQRMATAIVRYQDRHTGLWYQVLDRPDAPGNYLEYSASCMFTYALQKSVRLGLLSEDYTQNAQRAWKGILAHLVKTGHNGDLVLGCNVQSIGPRGTPYRNGSRRHYESSPVVNSDPKDAGAFLLAASEMQLASQATLAHGKTVLLDAWFNSQKRRSAAGQMEYFHYKWNDESNSGYSLLGHMFKSHGAALDTLYVEPTLSHLRRAKYYIIVSPDSHTWNPHPHHMTREDAVQIAAWVKKGGVLVLFANDPANADLTHLNLLADRFGIHFDPVLNHHIVHERFEPGYIHTKAGGPIFSNSYSLYMKDTCGLTLKSPAKPLLTDGSGPVIAMAPYGQGTVVAVVDPWLYNEYTDRRKLKPVSQNFEAGKEFVLWLLRQPR